MPRFNQSSLPRHPFARWVSLLVTMGLLAGAAQASTPPQRPRIHGVAQVSFYVTDPTKTRAFYGDFLGFAAAFSLPQPGAGAPWTVIKINDRQSVELRPATDVSPQADRLHHVAFAVDDAEAMRVYLQARGVTVSASTTVDAAGNRVLAVVDPNGHRVQFVEHTAHGMTRRDHGQHLPATRIANRMSHAGILVGQLQASLSFYGEILGFVETWRGGAGPLLSWVNLRVPDGNDYVEFMLYDKPPTRESLLGKHHICLEVSSVPAAAEVLRTRPLPAGVRKPDAMKVGVNGKRQINCYDPDGSRVEIMEPTTTDGRPVPPSQAPPPPPLPPYVPAVR